MVQGILSAGHLSCPPELISWLASGFAVTKKLSGEGCLWVCGLQRLRLSGGVSVGLWFETNHTHLQCTLQLKELPGQQATLRREGFAVPGLHRVTVEQPMKPRVLNCTSNVTDVTCEQCG